MKVDDRITSWLRSVGLEIEFTDGEHPDSFVRGVWLDQGKIIVNREVAHVGDVLHEAGHLACIPKLLRGYVEPGSLPTMQLRQEIENYMADNPFMDAEGREDPVCRGIMQMGDCEATAWSYAATKVLGITAAVLFEDRKDDVPYDGEGPQIWQMLDANAYMGINGLQAAGFCTVREFPKMRRWLAP